MTGRFVWHDLKTLDIGRARVFYGELMGWKLSPLQMGGFTVWLIVQAERPIGTLMQEDGVPSSHWMPYLAVEEVEGACQRVRDLGGQVCVRPFEVPRLGRFAVVSDPQGAFFSLIRRPEVAVVPPPAPGGFVWDELLTTDRDGAARFYGSLSGWKLERVNLPDGDYVVAKQSEAEVAGIMQMAAATHAPYWLPYLSAADVDDSTRRAQSLGATLYVEPRELEGVGRFAVLADPTGASFALFRSARQKT